MLKTILSKLGIGADKGSLSVGNVASEESPPMAPLDGESSNAGPRSVGFTDAVFAGWYNVTSGELVAGFRIGPEDIVLDVGCGDGGNTMFCAQRGAHVVFSDMERAKVEQLATRVAQSPAREFEALVSDTDPLPLADASATRVIAMEMLEHTEDPQKILRELVRVGRPGALYLITVPDPVAEKLQQGIAPAGYFEAPNHIRIFEREEFANTVEQAGLVIERHDTMGFYWTMWMLLFWLAQNADGNGVEGAVLDTIKPPYHPVVEAWSATWYQMLCLPEGALLKQKLDQQMPKTQVIVARKPL